MKRIALLVACLAVMMQIVFAADVTVVFSGLQDGDKASLTIASDTYLASLPLTADGTYVFKNVPQGMHSVKAEAVGYNVLEALTVIVGADGNVIPSEPLKILVTKMSEDPSKWVFEWKEDGSPSGYTTTANVNKPAEIEFLGKMIVPADVPSFGVLENNYHVVLANDGKEWTQEYAYRMVETFKTLPISYDSAKPAKFTLTDDHLTDDITVTDLGDGYDVRISEDVFYYANPFLVNLDGVRGRLFSKRLHHALTNFVTDFGRDEGRVDAILQNRFGCRVLGVNYEELTKGITDEDAGCFQQFKPSELVSIINMYEELPEGFHKIPHLNWLIRRQDGHKHPLYPEAAAVAWPVDNGYIEFMESAFDGGSNQNFDTLRLILHEKAHFLWAFVFSDEIKNEWIEIGGWYPDPNSSEGWSTTKDVEFVTQYAHSKNPDEDMAESIAFYLKDPEKLRSRSTTKYEFIRDRIMHGVRYISTVPDHLSFEVLNLWPDYDYPGKIKRVNVVVDGEAEAEKTVTMEIEINHIDGYEDGASGAYTRLTSPVFYDKDGKKYTQFVDIRFAPVDDNPYILRGSNTIPQYGKMGHWSAGDITLTDMQGNERYEGRNDCVVDVYVNNPLEDVEPAVYEPGSLNYELSDIEVEGRHCQNLKVTFIAKDNVNIMSSFARIYAEHEGFNTGSGLTDQYGSYDSQTQIAEVNFIIPDYYPSAYYYLPFIELYDAARTVTTIYFSESPQHQPVKKIFIKTPNPDITHPEIDLNRISVYAEPTHPEAPDGETMVTVNFYAKDDISGLGPVMYWFIDPQGVLHGNYWFDHRNNGTMFFEGDPTVWEHYQIKHILPQGSAPGRWGIAQMQISDKACNEYTYNFVETLIFEPDNDMSKYVLFADMDDSDMLYLKLTSESGSHFGYNYRVIHEESGKEVSGTYNVSDPMAIRAMSASGNPSDISVDVSSLPNGELIVIANILDENGKIETSKSTRVKKGQTSVAGIHADNTRIMLNGRTVTVFSDSDRNISITTIDGRQTFRHVVDGKTTFELPGEGFYIIDGRKFVVR